jgi:hypothetical protein
MAGIKITNFLGTAPKISPELLPNTAAQTASNCKLYSGDLLPYPQPVVIANTLRTGTIKTLFALRDPDTDALKWLSWATDVDIAVASSNENEEQRFYYSGDGAPKVSNYELATTGAAPYPTNYYDLGLPLPPDATILTTVASTFTTKTTASFFRDAGNIATINAGAAHGLRTGNTITISGFTFISGTYNQAGTSTITVTINAHGLANGASVTLDFTSGTAVDGTFIISNVTTNTFDIIVTTVATTSGNVNFDLRGFNATNVVCTVTSSTAFTYFSPGIQIGSSGTPIAFTTAKIDLGGLTQTRSYVFTWYTPWDEESIASKPSVNLYIKEGITVTVSGIPTVKPSGNNFIRGVRLYRTLAAASGTEYFLLSTLWFPTGLTNVARASNVSTVQFLYPHNLSIDDRFKISGCTDATFNITGGIVLDAPDDYTITYAQTAANVTSTTVAAGTMYHDVSENQPTTAARYWGDGSYDFVDDFDSLNLTDILVSDEYDAPPDNLQGLTVIQNNILVGFVGNTLYFSEPGVLHAWPTRYALPLAYDIVGLAALSGSMLVTTKGYPYLISGSDPASGMASARIDALYPCLNSRSMVTMGYGIVYSTHDGLAVYSPNSGPTIITKLLYNNDTWGEALVPSTVIAEYYGENYFASHSGGAFVFEQDQKTGGSFVDVDYSFTASWYDTVSGHLYYVNGTNGDIYQWDDLAQPSVTQEWKSKVIVTKDMINLGAARVVADYSSVTVDWDAGTTQWQAYTNTWNSADEITFRMWVDKSLILETQVGTSNAFRLPSGYRTDTFEVGVEGNIRVRAIHLAETPLGLKET